MALEMTKKITKIIYISKLERNMIKLAHGVLFCNQGN